MFNGVGSDDDAVKPILRQLRMLLSVMVAKFGRCVVVSQHLDNSSKDQEILLFDHHIIRIIHVDGGRKSEIKMDFDDEKLTDHGKEVSIGFVASFGNEVERLLSGAFAEKAKLYSLGES